MLFTDKASFISVNSSVVAHKYIHGAFDVGKMETVRYVNTNIMCLVRRSTGGR